MSDYASRALGIAGFGGESIAEIKAAQRGEFTHTERGNTDIPLLGLLLVLRQECLGAQINIEALDGAYAILEEAMHTPAAELQGIRLSDGAVRTMEQIVDLAEVALRTSAGYVQRVTPEPESLLKIDPTYIVPARVALDG